VLRAVLIPVRMLLMPEVEEIAGWTYGSEVEVEDAEVYTLGGSAVP